MDLDTTWYPKHTRTISWINANQFMKKNRNMVCIGYSTSSHPISHQVHRLQYTGPRCSEIAKETLAVAIGMAANAGALAAEVPRGWKSFVSWRVA